MWPCVCCETFLFWKWWLRKALTCKILSRLRDQNRVVYVYAWRNFVDHACFFWNGIVPVRMYLKRKIIEKSFYHRQMKVSGGCSSVILSWFSFPVLLVTFLDWYVRDSTISTHIGNRFPFELWLTGIFCARAFTAIHHCARRSCRPLQLYAWPFQSAPSGWQWLKAEAGLWFRSHFVFLACFLLIFPTQFPYNCLPYSCGIDRRIPYSHMRLYKTFFNLHFFQADITETETISTIKWNYFYNFIYWS